MTSWVQLFHRGQAVGGGVLLTSRLAVTAYHCVREIENSGAELAVSLDGGPAIPATLLEKAEAADLALIEVSKPTVGARALPSARGSRGDKWFAPCRPTEADPELTGSVAKACLSYACQGGASIIALQLTTANDLSNYQGYSGGPVVREPELAVLGILIEQYPDRINPDRATNTLFAASVLEIFDQFDMLATKYWLSVLLSETPTHPRSQPPKCVGGQTETGAPPLSSSQDVGAGLSAAGELEPDFLSALTIRLAKRVLHDDE